ncbi:TlpA disulfide reductase family protein [Glutamicibacter protophormiae]|uniref:TlpA family protein disulfide reductase n=1 Tax=Kocuria TaxID=57493 RepID=UPI001EE870EC|nr:MULTISPECIES: TlpA disulfide reductase family protein [Kocuria]WNB88982.1 TlpA disulfide reductase family protein [Glutamicibacter protophormiae]
MNPLFRSPSRPAARARARTGLVAVVAALGLALAGCSTTDDNLAQQANAGGDKGYVAGDGSVSEYAPADRGEPVAFDAEMFDGSSVTAESLRGRPAVVNFWYAGCAPCRAEAPDLVALHGEYKDQAQFLGVNLRDQQATAEAFERNFGVDYPSASDLNGAVLLALSDYVPPQAVPTTLVLDSKGRVAARVLGKADKSTLDALIKDTVAETA